MRVFVEGDESPIRDGIAPSLDPKFRIKKRAYCSGTKERRVF